VPILNEEFHSAEHYYTLNTVGMKLRTSYVGWDFEKVWAIDVETNNGYPYLRQSEDSGGRISEELKEMTEQTKEDVQLESGYSPPSESWNGKLNKKKTWLPTLIYTMLVLLVIVVLTLATAR
jgi:hypothetical protein